MIKETIRHIEVFTCRLEVDPHIPLESLKEINKSKLLEYLRPFVESQHFRRHGDDPGYLESRIWLPYVKDQVIRDLESRFKYVAKRNTDLQNRINKYNALPWWRKMLDTL